LDRSSEGESSGSRDQTILRWSGNGRIWPGGRSVRREGKTRERRLGGEAHRMKPVLHCFPPFSSLPIESSSASCAAPRGIVMIDAASTQDKPAILDIVLHLLAPCGETVQDVCYLRGTTFRALARLSCMRVTFHLSHPSTPISSVRRARGDVSILPEKESGVRYEALDTDS
jgi:hypothetical protein